MNYCYFFFLSVSTYFGVLVTHRRSILGETGPRYYPHILRCFHGPPTEASPFQGPAPREPPWGDHHRIITTNGPCCRKETSMTPAQCPDNAAKAIASLCGQNRVSRYSEAVSTIWLDYGEDRRLMINHVGMQML